MCNILRRSSAVALITASLLALVLLVGSASAASGTAVRFGWTMQVTPGHRLRVKYVNGLDRIQASDLTADSGAISEAKFASHDFEFVAATVGGRFTGSVHQSVVVTSPNLHGSVTVPADSDVTLRNLSTGEQHTFGPGQHPFTIGTGVGRAHR
jgi:hypothetical protein